jgi:acyl carrier protein
MDTILEILASYYEDDDLSQVEQDSQIMDDLGLSSMDFFSLITDVEMEFDIHISEREIQQILTVGDIARLVEEKTGGK